MLKFKNLLTAILTICCLATVGQNSISNITVNTIDSLSQILSNAKSDSLKVSTLNNLAWSNFRLAAERGENKDQVINKYANEALNLAKKINNKYQQGLALYTMATLERREGKLAEALKKYYSILKLSEEIDDKLCAINQYSNIGEIYSLKGDIPEAIDFCLKAVTISKQTGDKQTIIRSYTRLGNIYNGAQKSEEALQCYLNAFTIAKEINDIGSIIDCSYCLGSLYKNTGKYEEAKKYSLHAIELSKQTGTICYNCYIDLGWTFGLETYFDKTKNQDSGYSKSLEYFQKALELGIQRRSNGLMNEAYWGLIHVYKQLNNYQKALEYTELKNQLQNNDSISSKDVMAQVAKIKAEYEKEKILSEEHTRQQLALARQKTFWEKRMGEQRLEQEIALINEKNLYDKNIAEQKYAQDKKTSEERSRYDKALAAEKLKQEKLRSQQQTNYLLMAAGILIVIISSVFLILLFRQQSEKRRAIEKAEASHKMAELELQSLRAQLNPHFMFNSLNSIQTLILKEENEKSQSYLSRFARLLRMLLENAEKPFIPLQKEIEFLQLYLSLESLRVPELQYSISTDPSLNTQEVLIPNMILQPYVENAIWHGLSHKKEQKYLQIRMQRENGSIKYEIEDNGVGRKKAEELKSIFRQQHESRGMKLLSKRFKLLNEEFSSEIETNISDVITNNEVTGTLVTIKTPVKHSLN